MSFFPQMLKVRRQGGRDLSMVHADVAAVRCQLLWFAYGVINRRAPRSWSRTSRSSVSSRPSTIMKIVLERRGSQERRQRIAIDMDEVMADALTEHRAPLQRARSARSITAAELSGRSPRAVRAASTPGGRRGAARRVLLRGPRACCPTARRSIRELADRHDVFIASAAMDVPVLVRCEVPLAAASLSVHSAVAHRLLRRQDDRRRRLSDRRPTATLREVQGAGRCCSRRRTMPERPVTRELHPGKRCANISPGSIHVLRDRRPPTNVADVIGARA